jgi:hypothetical protein
MATPPRPQTVSELEDHANAVSSAETRIAQGFARALDRRWDQWPALVPSAKPMRSTPRAATQALAPCLSMLSATSSAYEGEGFPPHVREAWEIAVARIERVKGHPTTDLRLVYYVEPDRLGA